MPIGTARDRVSQVKCRTPSNCTWMRKKCCGSWTRELCRCWTTTPNRWERDNQPYGGLTLNTLKVIVFFPSNIPKHNLWDFKPFHPFHFGAGHPIESCVTFVFAFVFYTCSLCNECKLTLLSSVTFEQYHRIYW